jgi:predicted phage terminase large subunit-like protein
LIEKLEQISAGTIDRLMITMPPGSAKSTYASVLFPAWWLAQHPRSTLISASHTAELAETFGRRVRDLIIDNQTLFGYGIRSDNKAVGSWSTNDGSTYFAVGIGGAVAGRRADCLVSDTSLFTKSGTIRIDTVSVGEYILSYDTATNRPCYRRVLAVLRRRANVTYRIHTSKGRVVEATGAHPFYAGGKWIKAASVCVGDMLLCPVRTVCGKEGKPSRPGTSGVLFAGLLQGSGADGNETLRELREGCNAASKPIRAQECAESVLQCGLFDHRQEYSVGQSASRLSDLRGVVAGNAAESAHLLGYMQTSNACDWFCKTDQAFATGTDLSCLLAGFQAAKAQEEPNILRSRLCRESFKSEGKWAEQPLLEAWNNAEASVDERMDCRSASDLVPGCDDVRYVSDRRIRSARSPYQHDANGPSARELGSSLPVLPQVATCCGEVETESDTVSLVECIRSGSDVYDVQIEGTECFFANGILCHNCAILDDPIRNQEDADSARSRNRTWEWYQADLLTRLKPGGRVVLIQTRWHNDDLAGRLLQAQREGGDKWDVVNLPALAGANDPLGRQVGEALWPDWESAEALARKRKNISSRTWSALYQQQPQTEEGSILRRDYWRHWTEAAPKNPATIVISLDTAYSEKDSADPTACSIWHLIDTDYFPTRTRPGEPVPTPDMRMKCLLRFAWAERLPFPELITHILETVEAFKLPNVPLRMLVENKASGLSVVQEMRRLMPDLVIDSVNPVGDKVARAHSVTAMMESGRIYAMARVGDDGPEFRPWAEDVINECAAFPVGAHDDRVDTVTQALRYFRDSGVEFFFEDGPEIPKAGTLPHKMQF